MRIKFSKRGLTFSFKETETFRAGERYRYIYDVNAHELVILPDKEGKYKFSRKGIDGKPLVDLRNEEVRNAISLAQYMDIEICEDRIVVHIINKMINVENLSDIELSDIIDKQDCTTFAISKEDLLKNNSSLAEMLKVSGLFSVKQIGEVSYVYDTVSLFCGAGGLDYPFSKDESFDLRFALDFDKAAIETYKKNIGNHAVCMDIRELKFSDVPDADLIIGGPCCQGYSNANRKGNEEKDVAKRLLIDDYIKVVLWKKPLVFLIENVEEFLTKEKGKYLQKVLQNLSDDYHITYSVVNDSDVGGYSTRRRMLLFGSRKEVGKIIIPNVEIYNRKTVGDALKKVDSSWFNYSDISKPKEETIKKMAWVRPGHNYKDIPEMAHLDRHSNVYRRLEYDKPACTITNWRKVNLMPPEGNRILSVAEAAAIMGFPKDFKFLGTLDNRQQQVGNSVTNAIATFAKSIIKNALYGYTNLLIGG